MGLFREGPGSGPWDATLELIVVMANDNRRSAQTRDPVASRS